MNNTPENISKKKNSLAVTIMRYNKLKGKLPDKKILVVEGDDDLIFYGAIFNRLQKTNIGFFFPANGKDNVLGLRDHIFRSKEILKGGGTLYFIDKDFDDLKGRSAGSDIYVTSTYSIENILVCRTALRNILLTQFKLSDAETFDDVDRILSLFDNLLQQHKNALYEANRLIHFVRKKSLEGEKLTSGSISEAPSKSVEVKHKDASVQQTASGQELLKLISISTPIDPKDFDGLKSDFDSLDSTREWRGKFLFYTFQRFISILIEDRNSKAPNFFSKGGGKISIDTKSSSLLAMLSASCEIPDCLRKFTLNIESEIN
ncbi:DUF4435 domain-containing protein [Zoogloea sp. LCSB751]|uniref:DUF4435 domain-containing protein n=1 Tax=Zoogloea sp. LCSB751 TaxID=1965277 RepID=UPI0009A4D0E0|nr:DUF4435 domain-containing protein [Zoogloea sp. LCSB751]